LPPGNTLATALAIEPATFATTLFLKLRFFAVVFFDFDLVLRAFGALFVLDLDFVFVFAAVFAITDSATPSPLQITIILACRAIGFTPLISGVSLRS
jgi:hypothetical protein